VGLTASCFGLGATLSNYLGQVVVEKLGHIASLSGSLLISLAPIMLFIFMPETLGQRGCHHTQTSLHTEPSKFRKEHDSEEYHCMA
jgi:hypothetical protein